ncbi:hypothetical protein SAMN05216167_1675, partial [Spirosoma endophyticum]
MVYPKNRLNDVADFFVHSWGGPCLKKSWGLG